MVATTVRFALLVVPEGDLPKIVEPNDLVALAQPARKDGEQRHVQDRRRALPVAPAERAAVPRDGPQGELRAITRAAWAPMSGASSRC